MEPTAELVRFPEGYGTPTVILAWSEVHAGLIAAEHYWLVTTRPSGAPHVVPTDAKYGWGSSVDAYLAGVWRVVPQRVLAWNALNRDATRFTF